MTLLEAIEKYYDPKRNYKTEIKDYFKDRTGLSKQDGEDILTGIELIEEGKIDAAVSYIDNRDTEVGEIFYKMLVNKKGYDWHGNTM